MTPQEKALTGYKTKKQIKLEKKEAWRNRHSDPNYKGLGPGYLSSQVKAKAAEMPKKKDLFGWAGRVGQAHMRNQKAEHEKGYREDYR